MLCSATPPRRIGPGCNPLQPNPRSGSSATPCARFTQYEPQRAQVRTGYALGLFIQDQWKPTDWLTIVPGLRVDYGTAQNSRGEVTHNLLGFGPRIGASFDLLRDGKLLFRRRTAAATRSAPCASPPTPTPERRNRPGSGRAAVARSVASIASSVRRGGDRGYDLRGYCPDGSLASSAATPAYRCGRRPPTFTASLEREVARNVSFALTYTYRLLSNLWEDIQVNALRRLDGGGDTSLFFDKSRGGVSAYRPTAEATRHYSGLDFVLAGRRAPTGSSRSPTPCRGSMAASMTS